MSEKSEALRLADEFDGMTINEFYEALGDEAAAELRRQHAEIESLRREQEEDQCAIRVWRRRADQAEAKSDALLEKIKAVIAAEQSEGSGRGGFVNTPPTREHQRRVAQAWQELHAAIKTVKEGE